MMGMEALGARLRQIRIEHGYTQEAVSEAVGVTPEYISRIENNRTAPSWKFLLGFAAVLRVSAVELLAAAGLIPDTAQQQQDLAALASADPEIGELLDLLKEEPQLAGELLPFARYRVGERRREKEGVGDPGH